MMTAFLFTLQVLAATCPLLGGNAVYTARAILSHFESENYDDEQLCLAQGRVWKNSRQYDIEGITVSPNPSDGQFMLRFAKQNAERTFELMNVQGIVLQKFIIPANTTEFVFKEIALTNGIYSIKDALGQEAPVKIVIIH